MKRTLMTLMAIAAIALAGSAVPVVSAAGECTAGFTSKVNTSDGSIVLAAGLLICIKAGDGNTGTITTDGTSTLADYIEASGLLNSGGQVPNVSHYVVYGPAPTPTPTPTPPPPPPTPTPTPTPVPPTPTPTPVPPTPTPTPTPTGTPSVAQFAVTPDVCRFDGDDTRLRFRVIAGLILLSQVDIFIDGNLIDRNDIVFDAANREAFIVVEPGLRAWEIRAEGTATVLASGETLCPTCFAVATPTPTGTVATATGTPAPTLPPTDTVSDGTTGSASPLIALLFLVSVGAASLWLARRPSRM